MVSVDVKQHSTNQPTSFQPLRWTLYNCVSVCRRPTCMDLGQLILITVCLPRVWISDSWCTSLSSCVSYLYDSRTIDTHHCLCLPRVWIWTIGAHHCLAVSPTCMDLGQLIHTTVCESIKPNFLQTKHADEQRRTRYRFQR